MTIFSDNKLKFVNTDYLIDFFVFCRLLLSIEFNCELAGNHFSIVKFAPLGQWRITTLINVNNKHACTNIDPCNCR